MLDNRVSGTDVGLAANERANSERVREIEDSERAGAGSRFVTNGSQETVLERTRVRALGTNRDARLDLVLVEISF